MIKKRKGRTGWHQAALKSSKKQCNSTGIAARIKAVVVTLALWGWLPLGLAEWFNRTGGHDD